MRYTATELAKGMGGELLSNNDCLVNHVSVDSRSVQNSSNSVFFALETAKGNGHDFIHTLIEKGVSVFVVS